jgi:RNA polymerase sigma factor (sigma-70 family)
MGKTRMPQHFSDDLIMRHQPLAKSLAWKAGGRKDRDHMEDLTSVANVGLLKALKAYKPDIGVTFGAYAKQVARNEIIDFLRAREAALPYFLTDMDTENQVRTAEADDGISVEDSAIRDQAVTLWIKRLDAALASLSEREREIYSARRLRENPATLGKLAQDFGVSIERIRQIEIKAAANVQQLIAQPWKGSASRFLSKADRLKREIEALEPSKDPADNVTRSAVVAVFGISRSPACVSMESRIRRTFKLEARRQELAQQQRGRARLQGLTWAMGVAA